jgi:hypothetical protein
MSDVQKGTNEPKLRPCAHCGSGAVFGVITREDSEDYGAEFIECLVCKITTPLIFPCMDDPKPRLAEKWNRRARA